MNNSCLGLKGATAGVAALSSIALFVLWRHFWFLTDDAYIMFRYVANSHAGWGYVWNPPPFRPVEGYTSFLWVAILDGVWRVLGVEPPRSANMLSLLASAFSLVISYRLAGRLCRGTDYEPWTPALGGLVVAGLLANRTFLFSTSSGLETALQNALILAWISEALRRPSAARRTLLLPTLGALIALCRPDGLVYVVATCAIILLLVLERAPIRWWTLSPLLAIPCHLLWRHELYGLWLPNTYYAKVVRPWPEAGARYLESFVREYALFVPAAFLAVGVVASVTTAARRRSPAVLVALRRAAALSTPIAVAGYYTFYVGGDYFEYRPYSVIVPLVLLGVLWSARETVPRHPAIAAMALATTIAAACALSLFSLRVESQRFALWEREVVPIAPEVPAILRGYASRFDELQNWLLERRICNRYHRHKALLAWLQQRTVTREVWAKEHPFSAQDIPVFAEYAIGYYAWAMSSVAIIDMHGLNDFVVARTPVTTVNEDRSLGHDRFPPFGYVDCFRPNVRDGQISPRDPPLTALDIQRCEIEFEPGSSQVFPLRTFHDPVTEQGQPHGALLIETRPGRAPRRSRVSSAGFLCGQDNVDTEKVERRVETLVRIKTPGTYRFSYRTDDDGALWVGGEKLFSTASQCTYVFHLRFQEPGAYSFWLEVSNEVGVYCAELRVGPERSTDLEPIPLAQILVPSLNFDPGVDQDPAPLRLLAATAPAGLDPGVDLSVRPSGPVATEMVVTSILQSLDSPCSSTTPSDPVPTIRRWNGWFYVSNAGTWGMRMLTDDTGTLTLGGRLVLETPTLVLRQAEVVFETPGYYQLAIEVENGIGQHCLNLWLRPPGSQEFRPSLPGELFRAPAL